MKRITKKVSYRNVERILKETEKQLDALDVKGDFLLLSPSIQKMYSVSRVPYRELVLAKAMYDKYHNYIEGDNTGYSFEEFLDSVMEIKQPKEMTEIEQYSYPLPMYVQIKESCPAKTVIIVYMDIPISGDHKIIPKVEITFIEVINGIDEYNKVVQITPMTIMGLNDTYRFADYGSSLYIDAHSMVDGSDTPSPWYNIIPEYGKEIKDAIIDFIES